MDRCHAALLIYEAGAGEEKCKRRKNIAFLVRLMQNLFISTFY